MHLKFAVQDLEAIKNMLQRKAADGIMPGLEKMKEIVESHFDENPEDWQPLRAATIRQRQRLRYGAGPMLKRTGHLLSVAVQEMEVDSLREGHISTSDPMAVLQNNGGGNGIPGRPFYEFSPEEEKEIIAAFKSGIKW